jgi:hypothetical protein
MKPGKSMVVVFCTAVLLMVLSSCGKKEDNSEPEKDTQSVTHSDPQSAKVGETQETNAPQAATMVAAGQEITIDQFKFTIPKDWKGNTDTQVWFPGTEDENQPLPSRSLHHGARPLMGIPSFDAGIETHIGMPPSDKEQKNVGNMTGFVCKWQRGSYKSIGLFLLEKNAGMDLMYFFACQAPEGSFDQYVETYRTILNSVTLK